MNYKIAPWIEKDRKNIYDHKHVTREKRWRSWHFCKKNQQQDDNACLHKPEKKKRLATMYIQSIPKYIKKQNTHKTTKT